MAVWTGPAKGILAAERVALNFLQRLSGRGHASRGQYVQAVAGTRRAIYDTRKTTPGWRELEKYAVRCGGGQNHRKGLYDAVLIKDNHLAILAQAEGRDPIAGHRPRAGAYPAVPGRRGPSSSWRSIRWSSSAAPWNCNVDIILLDNMSLDQMTQAVALRDQAGLAGRVELEASGGITLQNVCQVALTGVERIAVGALTHSAPSVDIGLDIHI